ncbi:probable starch synthase 4, chloroplastic/amyloplastic isoform X3 [Tripterygium wilfordii]|uniref:probable starch synthase 4, chloroplastic/amyloplastic isoform X3 n=1 Tax=Tripterygium wilfordii TaxID=458696 RepID=UPI0018F80875|nr:probable starch synthase 4, chloroplastic/amyloplastic isoform X3 [Tripterygium wilfordii]
MLLETPMSAVIPSHPSVPRPNATIRARAVRCLRKNEDVNSLFKASPEMKLEAHEDSERSLESLQSSSVDPEVKHSDIWRFFREAQQNIFFINKQRLLAMEELDKIKKENQLLLDRVEQLEMQKQAGVGKDKQSMCWELLHRIDSMVLTGMINKEEAHDFRGLVVNNKFSLSDVFSDIQQKKDSELLSEFRQFLNGSKRSGLQIVHICTEMEPLVSSGSLAPYVTGLSLALQKKGHLVEVILPKYASLILDEVQGLREIEAESFSYFNGQLHGNRIWTGFSYFSRASLDYIVKSGKQPDTLHIHNWETAIVGPLFWEIFVKQGLADTRILLTCHSFDSQCLEQPGKLALCGLDPARLHRSDRLQDNAKTHLVNILKGGFVYSNKVVIVSSIGSKGRIIQGFNHGLEPTLATNKDKLLVCPSGVDTSIWDPSKDKLLPSNYSTKDMESKAVCKLALQQRLGLSAHASAIIVGCVFSDFSDINMVDLKEAVRHVSRKGIQFIFMGICEMANVSKALDSFREEVKVQDENLRFINKYDEALSHLIFAGSDIMLCQSFHDPVFQVPLKALKYGAAPIAITSDNNRLRYFADHDSETTKFARFISSTFLYMSLSQALDEIEHNPLKWKQMMMDCMAEDFSWDAECYDIHVSAYTAIKNL